MELFNVLWSRKSHRSYAPGQVSEEQLDKILAAGSAAPVGLPKQGLPHLTVIQDPALLKELGGLFGPEDDILYGAPTLIMVSSPEMPAPGVDYATAGCVIENMALAATEQGLGSIFLYGVAAGVANKPALLAKLRLPEGYHPVSALAVGPAAEPVALCKDPAKRFGIDRL